MIAWLDFVAVKLTVTVCHASSRNSPRKIGLAGSLSRNTPKLLPLAPLAATCSRTSTKILYVVPGVNPPTVCEAVGSELDSPQALSCVEPGGLPNPPTQCSSAHPPPSVQPFAFVS